MGKLKNGLYYFKNQALASACLSNNDQTALWHQRLEGGSRSSNVSTFVANSSAQLSDTGNLVLTDNSDGSAMWESFQIPTGSLVSKMRLSAGTKEKIQLTSWRSPSDPSIGSFSAGLNLFQIPQPCWRSVTGIVTRLSGYLA
ncbi:hypothetical protein ACH5RR_016197 [Cinchona calisaya]|uniref:Bulb-type lectin domain-containing protein n=1 Tax=Cinchona calisaya TaxID=153742 RepID=A0ABD2ZVN4_9GENT